MEAVAALRADQEEPHRYLTWLQEHTAPPFRGNSIGPDPHGWYSAAPCKVTSCERVSAGTVGLCRPCQKGWSNLGEPPISGFVRAWEPTHPRRRRRGGDAAAGIFRFDKIAHPVVRAELAWGLSERANPDHGSGPTRASDFNVLADVLGELGVDSVRTCFADPALLGALQERCGSSWSAVGGFIRRVDEDLADVFDESDRRVPLGRRRGGSTRYSTGQSIEQPWLRELVARWRRYRLSVGVSAQHVGQVESSLVRFADWCRLDHPEVRGPRNITRHVLLDWLAHVNQLVNPGTGSQYSAVHRRLLAGAVGNLAEVSRVAFDLPVPANAKYLQGEMPRVSPAAPRFIEPRIMEVLRTEANLRMIEDDQHRLIIRIMMGTGIRCGHVCALAYDALVDLNSGTTTNKWALRVVDTKADWVVTPPISPELAAHIRQQQVDQAAPAAEGGRPTPHRLLFNNPRARVTQQVSPESVNKVLNAWVRDLNVRDVDGTPVHVTPHRFRHTFAVEMLERGVPIDVVQKLLGHRSIANTQVYAQVTDKRMRTEWEKATLVDIHGGVVKPGDEEAADAEWLLYQVANATQPLANGYCGLPIQQKCPHANACLDCDSFRTSKEFLPVLNQQLEEHKRVVSKAEAAGHLRLVEINKRPIASLERIISTLDESDGTDG